MCLSRFRFLSNDRSTNAGFCKLYIHRLVLFRLIKTGDTLYLPVTQDPVPKTEDQLEEDAEVMIQLGTDKNASEMRARLMSASLLSDMESFKVTMIIAESNKTNQYYSYPEL